MSAAVTFCGALAVETRRVAIAVHVAKLLVRRRNRQEGFVFVQGERVRWASVERFRDNGDSFDAPEVPHGRH